MESLHQQFVQLGQEKFKLTNELLAILPEIFKKKIYKKYAGSIYEYAAKFGGLSNSAVDKRLRLEKYVADKPLLKECIKKVGVNKVAMVATLVTPENEEEMVDKLENMSVEAVRTLSKEMRGKPIQKIITLELDAEMSFLFLKLKQKYGKHLSNREVMGKILAELAPKKVINVEKIDTERKSVKRYIPASHRREDQCSYKECNKPVEVFHHQNPFSESHSHASVVPLCKDHHEFAHNGISNKLTKVDLLYRKYRNRVHSPT